MQGLSISTDRTDPLDYIAYLRSEKPVLHIYIPLDRYYRCEEISTILTITVMVWVSMLYLPPRFIGFITFGFTPPIPIPRTGAPSPNGGAGLGGIEEAKGGGIEPPPRPPAFVIPGKA